MNVEIEYEEWHGYTATIDVWGIITEGKNWNELMSNLTEAIQCTVEAEEKMGRHIDIRPLNISFDISRSLVACR